MPPIPDLLPGQDPWYDALVRAGASKPYPGTGRKYIADPGRLGPVTGSPLPPFIGNDGVAHDHNTLRIEGPNGFVIDAPENFTLNGRIMTGQIPGDVTVERASYGQSGGGYKVDAFARAFETVQPRLPAQAPLAPVTPVLSFWNTPCGGALTIDPLTLLVTVNPPPYAAPVGTKVTMTATDGNFWGQTQIPAGAIPAPDHFYVCVEDATARNAAGQTVPAYYLQKVTDDVTIKVASFNGPGGGQMTVTAGSSDPAQTLTMVAYSPNGIGHDLPLVGGTYTTTGLSAPPARVQVVSTGGGSAVAPVITTPGNTVLKTVPVAVDDTATLFENCSAAPAPSCANPVTISPLGNDTLNGSAVVVANSVIAITQAPRLGTAVLGPNGTITYTPNPYAWGADSIGYTVTVSAVIGGTQVTGTSNQAIIAITINHVNQPPVAVGDTTGALVGVASSLNVLANDSDPDGAADLASAVIVTGHASLGIIAGTNFAGGLVTINPPAGTPAGAYSFTYNAVDRAGLTSANPATVTVTVSTSEAILPAKAIYAQKTQQGTTTTGRWTVSGTVAPAAGQMMTITYDLSNSPKYKVNGVCTALTDANNPTIGTAIVDGTGAWLYDQILSNTAPASSTRATRSATPPASGARRPRR